MAITYRQYPTSPNMANNNLVYEVTSDKSQQPQYQFVMDIYTSGSADFIQRVKQQPNPSLKGVFDIGQIIVQYLGDDLPFTTAEFSTSSFTMGGFEVRMGEEYGTSPSSSVLLYNGIAPVTGSPAKVADEYYWNTNGLVDYPNAINFNFDSGSYLAMESASIYNTFDYQHALTNGPTTQNINDGEYATIALFNGNFMDPTSDVIAQDVAYVVINVYNAAGSNIQNYQLENTTANGGGPRTSMGDLWNTAAPDQTAGTRLIHIGVGPQNIADSGTPLNSSWAYYTVRPIGQGDDNLENNDGVWATLRFNKSTGNCAYNGVRFAWKNEFGVWDYYTFGLQSDSSTGIERQAYEQTFVDFSTSTNGIPYDKQRRGQSQFYNALTTRKTANSDWLSQADADWLKELFFSPNVYIQNGLVFEPVVIGSTELVEKTNPRTQKNFQYRIEFQPANQPRPRQ
jgi:hypothetical protein